MASSAASMAASRVLNLSNSSLRNLINRHLFRAAAAATNSTTHIIDTKTTNPEQLLFNSFFCEGRKPASFNIKDLNTDAGAANLQRNVQYAIGFSAHKIEADRRRGPVKDEDSDDFGDSDNDDDGDVDYDDGDGDGDGDGYYDDDDDDKGPPRSFRD